MELRKLAGQIKRRLLGTSKDQGEQLYEVQISGLYEQASQITTPDNLRKTNPGELKDFFGLPMMAKEWEEVQEKMVKLKLPQYTGGVNIGDQRALYYLLRLLKPATILEVGTHIGCSTVHIYQSLVQNGQNFDFLSVDIRDVNDENTKPWLGFKSVYSPLTMIKMLDSTHQVDFRVGFSTEFLEKTDKKFDFIFLDGDHSAPTVYKEIPRAMHALNKGGVILLHDYYPGCKPLFSDNHVVPGPFLGSQRLIDINQNFNIIPLGELPWPTKIGSKVTSLALVSAQ